MNGFIVKHPAFGLGRITAVGERQVTVEFFLSKEKYSFSPDVLDRALIGPGTLCASAKRQLRVLRGPRTLVDGSPAIYRVEYANGLVGELAETKLTPIDASPAADCVEALTRLEQSPLEMFRRREALVDAWLQTQRDAKGAKALLSSRIDLRPHQAFVAGTILLDQRQRYLLADEVGLGKTIEAGIVIHDLLWRNPEARVLIVCPGSLTQQWLCEMYAKFCGRIFHVADLHGAKGMRKDLPAQTIISFSAAIEAKKNLLKNRWDMIVVDEVHNLLTAPQIYDLTKELCSVTPAVLLLSALPAQRREDEYLRLLALLEPDRYDPNRPGAVKEFKALYDLQLELGRKIGFISRRLDEIDNAEGDAAKVLSKLKELANLSVLKDDNTLQQLVANLNPDDNFTNSARSVLHHVGDLYRINRRILRNRRARLIEANEIKPITRKLTTKSYTPDQFELDAESAVRTLLKALVKSGTDNELVVPLAKQLFQSLCAPTALVRLLSLAKDPTNDLETADVSLEALAGYEEWPSIVGTMWEAALKRAHAPLLAAANRAAAAWAAAEGSWERLRCLVELLRQHHKSSPQEKILLFGGMYALAPALAAELGRQFSAESVARFHFGMSPDEKEAEVRRFRTNPACWILISDETGGEGRNFQFADRLVHFDTPWYLSKIEQRIGRLDRLGRDNSNVESIVLLSQGGVEDGFVSCCSSGFEVFLRSISGLEFSLRKLEEQLVHAAVAEGYEGLFTAASTLKATCEEERASDESQDVMDAASNERALAAAFRRVQSSPDREKRLEQAFARYFQSLSADGHPSVWFNFEGKRELIQFYPEHTRDVELKLKKDEGGHFPDRSGTFLRRTAQERPDLEFFSVGNEFCDAVFESLSSSPRGRSYSIECRDGTSPTWRGFELAFRATGKKKLVQEHPALLNRLERVFGTRLERCFISDLGTPVDDPAALLSMRKALRAADEGRTWVDLSGVRAAAPGQFYDDWLGLIRKTEKVGRAIVNDRFEKLLAIQSQDEINLILKQIQETERVRRPGWKEDIGTLKLMLQALKGWDLELDSIGFLSINGGVLG